MALKNRFELVALLKKNCGYEGKGDLADVLAFVKANEGAFEIGDGSESGEAFCRKLFAKKVTIQADAGEELEIVEVEAPAEPALEGEGQKGRKAVGDRKAAKSNALGGTSSRSISKKAYDARAIAGKARFDSSDRAELAAASFRLKSAEAGRLTSKEYPQRAADEEIIAKAGSELVNSLGGALVADSYNSNMLFLTEAYGVARAVSNVQDMSGGDTVFMRKTGIVEMKHTSQGNDLETQANAYDNVTLVAKQIGCIVKSNRQIFAVAAIDVADDIAKSITLAEDIRIDKDYLLGDGTEDYGGHVGLANALPSGAYLAGVANSWAGQTEAYFLSAIGSVENVDASRLAWVMSRQCFVQTLLRLSSARFNGTGGDAIQARFIPGKNMGEAFGYPVYFSSVLPTVTASGHKFAYFGDFQGGSMVGSRMKLEIEASPHAGWVKNQIWTRGVSEVAVNIHGDGKGSTYGPIVCLKSS